MNQTVKPKSYGTTDVRKVFEKRFGKILTPKQHLDILSDVNTLLTQYVIDGNILHMPHGVGKLYVKKFEQKNRFIEIDGKVTAKPKHIDFGATNKLRRELQPTWTNADWKKIPKKDRPIVMLNNDHSDGYRYAIMWEKYYRNLPHSRNWSFKGVRSFTRRLAKRIKGKNKPTYYE